MTVRQFLAAMNVALGGGAAAYNFDDMANLTNEVSAAFQAGAVSLFAQQHLVNGPCGGWQDGDMVTYNQDSWGGDPSMSAAAALLRDRFGFVYTDGFVEVGIKGAAGFSMIFTSVNAVLDYQPSSGGPGPLNNDHLDPTSTSSGVFGGFVLALKLDVDFSDAGFLPGTAPLVFGNLRICGLTTTPAYNGSTVRDFIGEMNNALGGGPVPYSFDDVALLTNEITSAFEGGSPSLFAQQHLFVGTCPP